MASIRLDVLAFHAHPDDTEIVCGGTLARLAEQGHAVGACDMTRGEMGTRGSVPERQAELEEASRCLGLKVRINAGLPDSGLFNVREQQLRVVEILREYRPKVVILPALEQRHPDHAAVPRIVFDACYFGGLAKFPDLQHAADRVHRPTKIFWVHTHYTSQPPTFIVDISAQLEKKLAAIRAHKTQFPSVGTADKPSPQSEVTDWVTARGRSYGMMIGKKYGEGFIQREVMEIDDLTKVPGASL